MIGNSVSGLSIPGVPSLSGGVIDINGAWKTEQRRSKKGVLAGKAKTRVDVDVDPLIVDFAEKASLTTMAGVVRDLIKAQMRGITKTVSLETQARRQRAERERTKGTKSYRRRYTGGKTGETPPDPNSVKWGIDSGRFVNGVVATARFNSGGRATATVNVTANRLEPIQFGIADFARFRDELRHLVPALDGKLETTAQGRAMIRQALATIARDATASSAEAYRRKVRARNRLILDILRNATGVNLSGVGRLAGLL